ncbi:MAG: phosphatidylglycerophosphatase A [Candidatus Omnitrophota bacterium]
MKSANFIYKVLSTFFFVGYFPFIPGTFGSLAGIAVYIPIKDSGIVYPIVLLGLLAVGLKSSSRAEAIFKQKDSPRIVIDEVCGMLLSLIFIPVSYINIIAAFMLFRLFDAIKPYPIPKLEKLNKGLGVMADDILAGIYTNIVLQVALRLATFTRS